MGKIRCLQCNEILESLSVHDFVMCKCPNQTFVDGGNDYMRMGGVRMDMIEVLKDVKPSTKQKPIAPSDRFIKEGVQPSKPKPRDTLLKLAKEVKKIVKEEEREEEDMLRLTLEMVPKGNEKRKRNLRTIEIILQKVTKVIIDNDTVSLGTYSARVIEPDGTKKYVPNIVKNFDRSKGGYKLCHEVIEALDKKGLLEYV